MPVEHVLPFENVQNSTRLSYRTFIESTMRVRLGVRGSHGLPALAVQQDSPTRFFELVMRTNVGSVTFRLRMDNMYLIGYQMQNGRWLELNNDRNVHLITEQGTTFLGFTGHYADLERASGRSLTEIPFGLQSLVGGINQLATSEVGRTRAQYLIVVIMMFCEAARLRPVLEFMDSNYVSGGLIQESYLILIRSWGNLSAVLFQADANPDEPFQLIRENQVRLPNGTQIRTIPQVIETLGILLGLCFRNPRLAIDEGDVSQTQCFLGLPLVQVFSVRIDPTATGATTVYGTITVDDGLNTEYLFNRTSSNPQPISPGQNALLNGPSQSSLAISNFTINLRLILSGNREIVNNGISWLAFDIGNLYDQLISRRFDGTNGSVTVNYTVLRNSVAATITVTLEQGGGNASNVYGTVSGRYGNWREDPNTTSLLFNRSSNDSVNVRNGTDIPLLRSVVAVPVDGSLIVTASLNNYNASSADSQIAVGTVQLSAQLSGTSSGPIRTGGNSVRVTVNWSTRI